jgi:hypothetical protein
MSHCRPNAPALSLPTAFSSSLPPPPILRKRSFARIAKLFGIGTSTPVEDDEYVNSSRRRSGSETGEANNEDEGDNDEADGEGHMDEMTLLLDAQVSKSASAVHIYTFLAFLLRESTSKRQVVIYNTACSPSTTLPWSGRTKIDTVADFVVTSAIHRIPVLRRCRPTPLSLPGSMSRPRQRAASRVQSRAERDPGRYECPGQGRGQGQLHQTLAYLAGHGPQTQFRGLGDQIISI